MESTTLTIASMAVVAISTTDFEFFAPCAKGLEQLLANELRLLGARRVRPLVSGVAFFGDLRIGYLAALWSRLASRILLVLVRGEAKDANAIYSTVYSISWSDHIAPKGSFAIDASGANEALHDSRFLTLKIKDAICDRIRASSGMRPDIVLEQPDVRVSAVLRGNRVTVAIDISGDSLPKRGYRVESKAITAPLRESMAAALAATGLAEEKLAMVCDPLCGSGTIVIESAMMLADRAPGLLRTYWGHSAWLGNDATLWDKLLNDADERAELGDLALKEAATRHGTALIQASDINTKATEVARASAAKAGVLNYVNFSVADVGMLLANNNCNAHIITNPPYGERMGSKSQLPALYAALVKYAIQSKAASLTLITSDNNIDTWLGSKADTCIATYNGPIEATIRHYELRAKQQHVNDEVRQPQSQAHDVVWQPQSQAQDKKEPVVKQSATSQDDIQQRSYSEHSAFFNRLAKMAKHRLKWARRNNINCYRVYDADLPDYNVAIDIYDGAKGTRDEGRRWLVIAEYAAPKMIDEQKANKRLQAVLSIAPELLNVYTSDVYFRIRERSKGGSQYSLQDNKEQLKPKPMPKSKSKPNLKAKTEDSLDDKCASELQDTSAGRRSNKTHWIEEDGLRFAVEFTEHLDTGIFLDHRLTRQMLRAMSKDKRCLNLFAYTGTASVYMAAGGAASVLTLDLSNTYLQSAKANMLANNYVEKNTYVYEQADVLRWVSEQRNALRPMSQLQPTHTSYPKRITEKSAAQGGDINGLSARKKSGANQADALRYDLIFCDPPTFSNSKAMGAKSFSVQRDHGELLIALSRLLAKDGCIVFSTNCRNFKLDETKLKRAKVNFEDITLQTIPEDFMRPKAQHQIHRCYLLRRKREAAINP